MSWTLTNERGQVVAGPFDTPHEAIESQRTCPYVRLHPHDGALDLDAGFSASDHGHYRLVEYTPAA